MDIWKMISSNISRHGRDGGPVRMKSEVEYSEGNHTQ